MAIGTEGYPVVMAGTGDNGLFGGGSGGIASLLIGALLFGGGIGGFGRNNLAGAGYPIAEGAQLGQLAGIQSQLNSLQSQTNINSINSELESMEATQNNGLIATLSGIKDNANAYLQGTGQLATSIASGNFTTLQSINGLGTTITAQNNQNALQQLNSFNQLNTSVLQGFNEIGRDNASNFNQIIMGQNAMSAQMSACYELAA